MSAPLFPHASRTRDRLTSELRTRPGRAVFTTSLGLEDQVLTHLIAEARLQDRVAFATLDTGRLFPETYTLWEETEQRLGIAIQPFFPDAAKVEALVRDQGINGLYRSPEARKRCCQIRKLEPLDRALDGAVVWITGLRADQSQARAGVDFIEHDAARGLTKLTPLHDWTRDELAAFAAENDVPVSPLHARGFASIGCAPCTRAISPGEPERAGRWWWEQDAAKECGLHVGPDGRLVRARRTEVPA